MPAGTELSFGQHSVAPHSVAPQKSKKYRDLENAPLTLMSDPRVQQIVLTTFAKFQNLYSGQAALREDLAHVFTRLSTSSDLELQQRACEYLQLPSMGGEAMEKVLAEMPPFPEDKESPLVNLHVDSHQHETSDRAAWKISSAEKEAFASYDPSAETGDEQRQHSSSSSFSFAPSEQGQGRGHGQQADLLSLDDSSLAAHDTLEDELFGAPRAGGGRLEVAAGIPGRSLPSTCACSPLEYFAAPHLCL
jgi:hypothetical protein